VGLIRKAPGDRTDGKEFAEFDVSPLRYAFCALRFALCSMPFALKFLFPNLSSPLPTSASLAAA
jgi:hypothetical protein